MLPVSGSTFNSDFWLDLQIFVGKSVCEKQLCTVYEERSIGYDSTGQQSKVGYVAQSFADQ